MTDESRFREEPRSSVARGDAREPRLFIAGRYRELGTLGQGGMGSVLRVYDESAGSEIALKRLHAGASKKHVALFEREYHTLASLRHPHIVHVFEYGKDERGPYYTMELLDGTDLCRAEPRPWAEVCSILRDLASALSLLHVRRLLHRDVSGRNVWLTNDLRVKLIDFGTLSAFGTTSDVAGTPPFLPPEALHGQALDQRSDLYALGALGYFLLTGVHAYPARTLRELGDAWKLAPSPPSSLVRAFERADLPEVPSELDALIEALLSLDSMARPVSTAEVMGRLCALATLPSEPEETAAESYLSSKSFVGRSEHRQEVARALERMQHAGGQSFVIAGEKGFGRTRLLSEIALLAQLSNAVVAHVDAGTQEGVLSAATKLCLQLLRVSPETARECAEPYASVLGHVADSVRRKLELEPEALCEMPITGGEARVRVQAALKAWFLDFAAQRSLVVLIDNLEQLDDDSLAFVSTLAHAARERKLLIVSTLLEQREEAPKLALEALRQTSNMLTLAPLRRTDTEKVLRSVFGAAPHLSRLADLLHERSQGRPAKVMELAEHLVRERVITHADGEWLLPQSLDALSLPESEEAAEVMRLDRLPSEARELARRLSVHEGQLPVELCAALSEKPGEQLFASLSALTATEVLLGSHRGYRFRVPATQRLLLAELSVADRERAHRIIGEYLLARPGAIEKLSGGLHLLRAGDAERGTEAVAQSTKHIVTREHASIAVAAPLLESALTLFRMHRRSAHESVALLALLTLAGYYHDRRFADGYGGRTVATLSRVLGLRLARILRPLLGKKLALYLGFAVGAFGFWLRRKNPRVPTFQESLLLLFSSVASVTGVSTVCVDPKTARRAARVLEPLTALGPDHAGTMMHELCANLALTVEDRLAQARARWRNLIARLESERPIKSLPAHAKVFYYAGALYACGVLESFRDNSEALRYAEKLDTLGLKLYELSADQVRMLYYANQGDMEKLAHYRERVEMHAIASGTAWQVETWASGALITVALRTHDALRLKHALEVLKQLSVKIPSLQLLVERAQGAYYLLRGRPEAVAFLSKVLDEEPLGVVGWVRAHGALARAYNASGDFERAKDVCMRALDHVTAEDLSFSAMNLVVELELALAEAGLGRHAMAAKQLDDLLENHASGDGPLTLGALHEARSRVAFIAGDDDAFRRHASQMDRYYRRTGIASLIERAERLAREGRRSTAFEAHDSTGMHSPLGQARIVIERVLHGGPGALEPVSAWVLKQLCSYAELGEAYLFVLRAGELSCTAQSGDGLDPAVLMPWVASRLHDGKHEGAVTSKPKSGPDRVDPDCSEHEGRSYRVYLLSSNEAQGEAPLAALVCPAEPRPTLPRRVLAAVATRLCMALKAEGDDAQPESA
jgi:tetratricopeptide (TPR) repeat protein